MKKTILNIYGMHCASCAANIEAVLKKTNGVLSGRVNFATENAYIEYDSGRINERELIAIIEKSGYTAQLQKDYFDKEKEVDRVTRNLKRRFIVSIILSSVLMYVSMGPAIGLPVHKTFMEHIALWQFVLSTGVLICGYQFFPRGVFSVIINHMANMDTLVALGVGSAYIYSLFVSIGIWLGNNNFSTQNLYYEVAAFLLTFILLGKYLEALTKKKTSQAIKKLMNLRPKLATVIRQEVQTEIPAGDLIVGDIVVVKPGQRIPVDGKIIEGSSSVDESMVTGESIPVEKNIDDTVIGGTINKNGSFRFKAVKVGKETALAQIIKIVEEAQGSKAPIQEIADKIAGIFVPVVLIIAFSSFFTWILLGKAFVFALTTFITVLIIACPCSLGLATPTAVMVGTGKAAECGIIIKNAASLQIAYQVNTVIFDKTGTLTEGKPRLTDIVSYIQDENKILQISASLENKSEHPLAEAILAAAKTANLDIIPVENFESIAGKGIRANFENIEILLGNRRLMRDNQINTSFLETDLQRLENQGKTVMILAKGNKAIGMVAVRDNLKDFSRQAVDGIRKIGKEVIMLSGDNQSTAYAIAKEAGIVKVIAQVLPQDKLTEIKRLQNKGAKVAFVGDGINDAPALTQADLGIAIGTGTDVAIESGDIILIKDDLRDVLMAMDLSRYAMKKIKQNLFWAFFYNLIGIPVAAGILYPFTGFLLNPVIAGLAMAFSSVSVVSNSLLMRRYRVNI